MIKSYIKIAWRNLKKNRLYTFVNVIGLTIGVVSCLLIGIYIKEEFSYDRFNKNADRIARVTMDYSNGGPSQKVAVTGTKVGPEFKRNFPEVIDYVRILSSGAVVGYQSLLFKEKSILYADPSLLKIFSFKMLKGDVKKQLNSPDQLIVTESAAKKYFNDADPIGKILKVNDKDFMVSGVAEQAPSASQIKFDFILPFSNLNSSKKEIWWSANYVTYLLLKDKDQLPALQQRITAYMKSVSNKELKMTGSHYLTYHLEPLTSVHLHSNLPDGLEPNGSIMYIYILMVVAVLILIIACVNYVNLSIAQSAGRGAEIGVRKVLGAAKQQLFNQFIGESLLVTIIALLMAVLAAFFLLPYFNQVSGKSLHFDVLFDPVVLGILIVCGLVIGFVAGAYPALLLSNAKLSKILKSGFSFTSGQSVRRSLIIFQFIISIFLIITTIVILQQLSYIHNKDIGYNKSNVIVLPVSYNMINKVDGLKKEIANIPGVESVAAANNEPVNVAWGDALETADGKSLTVNALPMDEDFIKTMQLKIITGRDFNRTDLLQMDTTNQYKNFHSAFIINEAAAHALGWTPEQAVNQTINRNTSGKIVGVVKDFNFKSFHDPIGPLLIFLDHEQTQDLFVRVSGNNTAAALDKIGNIWKARIPSQPFEYKFLDDDYDALYRTEQRTSVLFTTFSALAIFLACMGLFAITAYAVVQRTKEIGIRKVMGASISTIIVLISKDFLLMVVIATVIASPLAWYMAHTWLQDFAYRITIHWWIFIGAGAVSLIVAGLTIGMQAFKAALANPVDSLRSE